MKRNNAGSVLAFEQNLRFCLAGVAALHVGPLAACVDIDPSTMPTGKSAEEQAASAEQAAAATQSANGNASAATAGGDAAREPGEREAAGRDQADVATASCAAGMRTCQQDELVICAADGTEAARRYCEFGCSQTRADCNSCMPSTVSCDGNVLSKCAEDGSRLETTECTHECSASDSACVCGEAQRECGGECVPLTDLNYCDFCRPCHEPEHGKASCVTGECDFTCERGTLKCSRAVTCEMASWDFETGLQEWMSDDPRPATVGRVRAHGGVSSLQFGPADGPFYSAHAWRLVCKQPQGVAMRNGHLDLSGKTVSYWVYMEVSADPALTKSPMCHLGFSQGESFAQSPADKEIAPDQWNLLSWSADDPALEGSGAHANIIHIGCRLNEDPTVQVTNITFFIDDFSIQ